MSDTEWIKPGAEVVASYHYAGNPPTVKVSTIRSVAQHSFTVDGVDQRFKMDRLRTAYQGGNHYEAHRPGSDEDDNEVWSEGAAR